MAERAARRTAERAAERSSGRAELRAVRAVLRRRGDRLGLSEVSYRIYLAVMLVIIVGAPAVRATVLWLQSALPTGTPDALTAPGSLVAPVLTALTGLLVLAGAHGGPAHAALPQLDLLHTTPIPRARLLLTPVRRGLAAGAGVGALLAALVAAARWLRGELVAELGVSLIVAGAGVGLLGAGAVLVGQIGRRTRGAAAAALALLALGQWRFGILPDPWSALAWLLASPGGVGGDSGAAGGGTAGGGTALMPELVLSLTASPFGIAAVPLLAGLLLVALTPLLVTRMRWEALRAQAAGTDAVRVLAVSGDPSAALARLGSPVRTGRRWRLRPIPNLTASIVRRDLLGVARTPARSFAALVGICGAGMLWVRGLGSADPVPAALLGAASLLLAYLAVVPWCRGLAAAAAGSGSAPLLPASPAGLAARHLIVPGVLSIAALLGGVAWGSVVWGNAAGGSGARGGVDELLAMLTGGWIPVSGAFAAATALVLRLLAAFKGALPMKLLAPVPTPVGDMAGINVLLWSLDGPISAVTAGALLGVLWSLGIGGGVPVAALTVSVLTLIGFAVWARVRMAPVR